MFDRLKKWAQHLKKETYALYFAYRDPRVPWYAKLLVAFVVAHTFSPIDLIPDFVPVLGYLDDLIITPLGLALALRLISAEVMAEARIKAEAGMVEGKIVSRVGLLIVISIWLTGLLLIMLLLLKYFRER
ncbi:MAG: YkvA family protein [Candidatus Hodarchaeota archaeon]